MSTSRVLTTLTDVLGASVDCLSVELTVDETWTPRVQATVVVPLGTVFYNNPATVTITRLRPAAAPLSEVSAANAGKKLSDLTAANAGKKLSDLTARWAVPAVPGWVSVESVAAKVRLRKYDQDYVAGTLTLTLASDECVMQESSGRPIVCPQETMLNRFVRLLGEAGMQDAPYDQYPDLTSGGDLVTPARPGTGMAETVWNAISESAAAVGRRAGCDLDGRWNLWDTAAAPPRTVTLTEVFTARVSYSRDNPAYAERIAATLHATDSAGADVSLTSVDPPFTDVSGFLEQHYKTEQVSYGPVVVPTGVAPVWPVDLAAVKRRALRSGGTLTVTAPLNLSARPGDSVNVTAPGLPALTGVAASVSWRVDESTAAMTITTRSYAS